MRAAGFSWMNLNLWKIYMPLKDGLTLAEGFAYGMPMFDNYFFVPKWSIYGIN